MSSSSSSPPFTAFVRFPSAFLTALITASLRRRFPSVPILPSLPSPPPLPLLQFADYDLLDHSLTLDHAGAHDLLASSYVIRKSLIRKHYLASAVAHYLAKHPDSLLATAVPRTWAVEIRFADELEEMWADDLWDLGQEMDEQEGKEEAGRAWWILKPGMADKGQGIRMFSSKAELEEIFEEFEEDSEDEDEDDKEAAQPEETSEESTKVSMQQMRHFVIQEYVPHPLLLDPLPPSSRPFTPHKFHIRAYCISHGASPLTLYLHPRLLCLFAPEPFSAPSAPMGEQQLSAHLTNTCLQREETKERFVLELGELAGRACVAGEGGDRMGREVIAAEDVESIRSGVGEVLAETWRAAVSAGQVHFQPLPNAFELFGCDLLVSLPCPSASSHTNDPSNGANSGSSKFRIHLLEVNACPDVEQTGVRLNGVIDDLVEGIVQDVVLPWAKALGVGEPEKEGRATNGLIQILELGVRGHS
ncbi:tubulin-tyrosine ligase [Calocera cornea HHB12733]|uniref:Tubulin-tyrosine ligase n=1 Tax=Calocera cornea HHB12733 TaxID=1353952 RepID=A0A165DW15_9BASI|nr:tubulin-tyrosine ligase [Calocera cornea HHB12733]